MKKIFFTVALIISVFCANAQFTLIADLEQPAEKLGVGYQMDQMMVGVQQNGDNYDVFGRYNMNDNFYISAQAPSDFITDSLRMGVGISIKFWINIFIEPNYNMNIGTSGSGKFTIGVACRFY